MKKILIVKNWDYNLDLLRQTPSSCGQWEDFEFSLNASATSYDYLLILNRTRQNIKVSVPRNNVFALIQEPPNEVFKPLHRGQKEFSKVFCQDTSLKSNKYIYSQPALPWFINRTYDELKQSEVPLKTKKLSCISSKNYWFAGHRNRLRFIEELQKELDFDLFGWGFNYIQDKWDGLAPYKYSIVLENFQSPYYWSEKLSDCLLSFTMPIYCGCTNIDDFFPKKAIVKIDINSTNVIEKINEVVNSDLWEENLESIITARQLILDKYQLFPFIVNQIEARNGNLSQISESITIPSITSSSVEMLLRSKYSVLKNNVSHFFQKSTMI